jgi:hypothetical protein
MQDSYSELIKLLLPKIIVEYFELIPYKKSDEVLHLYLKELYSTPKEYRNDKLSYKGFFDEITVQDFPIRGRRLSSYHIQKMAQ